MKLSSTMKKKLSSRGLSSIFPIFIVVYLLLSMGFVNPGFTESEIQSAVAESSPYYEYVVTKSISTNPIYQRVALKRPVDRAQRRQTRVHYLLENLRHKNEVVRIYASSELGKYPEFSDYVIPMLVDSLSDSSKYVRRNSAKSLGAFGNRSESAIPALRRALGDSDKYVAHSVANSLRKIGTVSASRALEGFDDRVR